MRDRLQYTMRFVAMFCIYGLLLDCSNAANDEEVLSMILASSTRNLSSIHSATGKAIVSFDRQVDEEYAPGPGQMARSPAIKDCYERRKIEWYVSGEKRRTDELSLDIPEDKREYAMCPVNKRQCWSPDSNIYAHFRPSGRVDAYIGNPMKQAYFVPRMAVPRFDPMSFFIYFDKTLAQWVDLAGETEGTIAVISEAGQYLVSITWDSDSTTKASMKMVIDPQDNYNVTHASAERDGKSVFEVQVQYMQTEAHGRSISFPKRYVSTINAPGFSERVEVDFFDVALNSPIDDSVFSFEGMQVPARTAVRDMRSDPADKRIAH